MKRYLYRWFAGLQIGFIALSGCHPTQPFFLGERGDLAHYLDRAQSIEYPDLHKESLPEVTQSYEPLSLDNQNFVHVDLTLEQCIGYALVNTQVVRALQGTQRQNADMASVILSSPSQQLLTQFDPAITATTTNSQPLNIDQNGNRLINRGSARANQVGGVEDALSEFDAQFSSFLSYNTTDRARNVGAGNVFNPQFFQAKDTTAQMALSKRVATGGVVTLRSQTVYSNNNIPTQASGAGNFGRAVPTDYTQVLEAQWQHPLLRGRGTQVNRIPVVLARINEEQSVAAFEERVRNLVRDVEFAYWDLYAAYQNVETAQLARDSASLAYKIALRKYESGQSGQTEAQARVQVHQFQAALNTAVAGGGFGNDPGVYGREKVLRVLMGWAPTDGRLVRPSDKPTLSLAQFDWEEARAEALRRNIDIRNQKWLIKQKELQLISSRNSALPDLNISLLYRWLGVGGSLLEKDGGNPPFPQGGGAASAWEELLGGHYQEGAVRVDFTPNPIGSRRVLNDIRNKQLELARECRVLETKEEMAIHKLDEYWRNSVTLRRNMAETLQALNAAQRFVEIAQAKFDAGDANQDAAMDVLVRAQQTRATAGQNYFRAVAEYNKNLVDFHVIKGSLLEYNNIALEEGLWPEKAYWDAHERARERDAAKHLDYGASRPKVISQGDYQQFQGTANQTARPASSMPGGPAPAKKESKMPGTKPESVPSSPERSNDLLPEKRANYQTTAPKFEWSK
jgi:outer membrane protein TolC